ncbi:MAG: hypothetical protein IKI45_04620, partial [Oscillospiraceae bacterium]|nr:hypothetical protein [Oscillospiraceae bacterium]
DICLSFCHDTALEILALRQQGCGFLPCLMTKILRIYSSRFNWYINIYGMIIRQRKIIYFSLPFSGQT